MTTEQDIAQRLQQFGANIQKWRDEAARLTMLVARSRQSPASKDELTALEETAGDIYAEIAAFQATVDEVARKSPAAAAELSPASDAIRLVLLEITELGIRLYSTHSRIPHEGAAVRAQ
jgi:hypothetical protein